jgi:ABC-type Fe3+/spermidine/putrescine transport system ATPase subunit
VASVELRGLTKRYGELAVVDDVSLTIEHGRLVCLLGPSGCGKTTTLRLIAGFVEPSAGEIRVGDQLMSSPARTLPPERRNMSMIFQSYALWPHLTVAQNVGYGLRFKPELNRAARDLRRAHDRPVPRRRTAGAPSPEPASPPARPAPGGAGTRR